MLKKFSSQHALSHRHAPTISFSKPDVYVHIHKVIPPLFSGLSVSALLVFLMFETPVLGIDARTCRKRLRAKGQN